ncbi:class I SAM-dependent methyltransferase [bacterium]|nr:class I SAM-dependent methyltransferase [bacterium]
MSYLHGYSDEEQKRLTEQAEFLEFQVFQDVNFSDAQHILEVGCGVGAQSQILLRRFPKLRITGVDLNEDQLKTLNRRIGSGEISKERMSAVCANAENLPFKEDSFDGAFFCWILEHVPSPEKVLAEAKRVLRPGSKVVISEVMNSSFFLDPYSPNVLKYWAAFNDYQYDKSGDPFTGVKLGNFLLNQEYKQIRTAVKSLYFDNREPLKRENAIDYWTKLLLSAAPQLLLEKYVEQETVDGMKKELAAIAKNPSAVFFYAFIQATAEV